MEASNRKSELGAPPKIGLNWRVLGILESIPGSRAARAPGLVLAWGSRGLPGRIATAIPDCRFGIPLFRIRKRGPGAQAHGERADQTIIQATIDITCLILLCTPAGAFPAVWGCSSWSPVGGLAFLLPPRSALFLAAVTAIVVLVHTIWQQIGGHTDITVYASAGFLGLVLFTIAASASVLATRVRESEDLVRQKDLDLANLADLSQYIVQHLRESLLVVDTADKIRLINESAAEISGISTPFREH